MPALFVACSRAQAPAPSTTPVAPPSIASSPAAGVRTLPPLVAPLQGRPFLPEALAIDGLDRLFVLDRSRAEIVRVSADGEWLPFAAGAQGGTRFAQLSRIFARWGPDLFALAPATHTLYHFDLDGHLRATLRYGGDAFERTLGFVEAADVQLTKAGELIVLDRAGGRILLFDRFGAYVTDLAAASSARPRAPVRMEQDPSGTLYVLDPPSRSIFRFTRQGQPLPDWSYASVLEGGMASAAHLAWTVPGRLIVLARDASWACAFTADGRLESRWRFDQILPELGVSEVTDLVASSDGTLHLARPGTGNIARLRLGATHVDGASPHRSPERR